MAKHIIRISPLLLGQIGDAAAALLEGSLIVQFAGTCVAYSDAKEWNVTHAIISNSLAVSCPEQRTIRNRRVDAVMHAEGLTHVGWLRQASADCPLSSLDLETQRVYEAHLPDAFAAMLDMGPHSSGPVVYFYCLADPRATKLDAGYNAFVAAQHVVLDTSVPYSVVQVSLGSSAEPTQRTQQPSCCGSDPNSSSRSSQCSNSYASSMHEHQTMSKHPSTLLSADDESLSMALL